MAKSRSASKSALKTDVKVETFPDHSVITQPNPLRRVIRRADHRDTTQAGDIDAAVARAEQALAGLSGEFRTWMQVECDRLVTAHALMLTQGISKATRDELFRAAHDIKGDAATFGFPTAGAAAHSLCRIIEHAPALDRVPPDLIIHHINAIQAIVREHTAIDTSGMADELSRKLRAVADDYLTVVNHDRPDHLEAILSPSLAPAD